MYNEVKSGRVMGRMSGDKKLIIRLGGVILLIGIISISLGAKGCLPPEADLNPDVTSGRVASGDRWREKKHHHI